MKYASIKFLESAKEFIVTTQEKKMGIMSVDSSTKIKPEYDSIKQIDKDEGLYLVTNNRKQGVINEYGSIIIYLEYDQIGVNASKYSDNIQNQYLLYNNCIPVCQNGRWRIFDKTGRQIKNVEYEDLGCSVGGVAGDKNANGVLLVPKYEGIVIKSGNLYGIIDSKGEELIPTVVKSIYSTTSAGETNYYMISGEQVINVIDYIEKYVLPEQQRIKDNDNATNQNNTANGQNTMNNNQTSGNTENSGQTTTGQEGGTTPNGGEQGGQNPNTNPTNNGDNPQQPNNEGQQQQPSDASQQQQPNGGQGQVGQ